MNSEKNELIIRINNHQLTQIKLFCEYVEKDFMDLLFVEFPVFYFDVNNLIL